MLAVKLAGLGYYLPERRVTNAELEAAQGITPGWIGRVTGVQERRYAGGETSAGMAAAAARMALAHAGLGVDDLDLIVGASAAPQQTIPCTAVFVQRELGAPEGASACFDVNATCLSFLFALQTTAHLVAAGVYRTALVFSSEIASVALNPQERESSVLFGDAAAAAIVTRSAPGEASALWHSHFATHSSGAELSQVQGGGTRRHPNNPTTTPQMNQFEMRGLPLFMQVAQLANPFLDDFCATLGWERGVFDAVVPHQASGPAVDVFHARFGFRPEQLVVNLPLRGNCVAASIPLALAEAVHGGRIRRGDRVLLLGSGAGLTLGAVALTF
jgi:3-oxoacyl-[acyl-carrier-protein] synthase-3